MSRLAPIGLLVVAIVLGAAAPAAGSSVVGDTDGHDDGTVRDVAAVDVVPANRSALDGVHDIEAGTALVVRGTTTRRPGDAAVDVSVTRGPDADLIGFAVVETWGTDGRWAARLPVPEAVRPGVYTLRVRIGDETDDQRFEVVEGKRAAVTVREATGESVVVDATLPDGGYVELRDGDRVRGVSEYLDPGSHDAVSIPVDGDGGSLAAVAVVGTADRRLDAYTTGDGVVSATVPSATPRPTATATGAPTPTSTPRPTATATEPPTTTDVTGPGFGALAPTAALAWWAAVLLSRARSR